LCRSGAGTNFLKDIGVNRVFKTIAGITILSLTCGNAVAAPQGILGYLNPRTHIFSPLMQSLVAESKSAAATGTLQFEYTITVKSPVPSGGITCSAEATVFTSTGADYIETAGVAATISGSTATCTVVIPYSWAGATSSDSVMLSYNVFGSNGVRVSDGSLATIAVPANGTTKTIAAKLVF
jgi:hypothetical protein